MPHPVKKSDKIKLNVAEVMQESKDESITISSNRIRMHQEHWLKGPSYQSFWDLMIKVLKISKFKGVQL